MLYEEEHPFAIAYRLVEEGKLDPWNVDIAQLANLMVLYQEGRVDAYQREPYSDIEVEVL